MSNRRRLIPLVLGMLILAALPVSAQQTSYTITGRTLDEVSQAPVSGAQVLVRGTQFGGLSNQDGRYTIQARLAPGSYTLEVQMIGRETVTRPVVLGTQPTVTVPDIALHSVALSMEELVVTGTAAPTAHSHPDSQPAVCRHAARPR